jgi:hypothetical protein
MAAGHNVPSDTIRICSRRSAMGCIESGS